MHTNFNSTAYYFKCSDGFEKSLALLLKMVSSAYFTDENVEKEKGIIKQEIKMYEDDPNWQGYFNLLKCMYQKSGVKENIAGDESSVNKMTPDILYGCYNNFYTKDNAAVICCGDIDAETVFESISQNLSLSDEKNAEIINPDEDEAFVKDFVKRKMNTGQNIFNIGFKESEFSDTIVDRICETKILLDIICGKSSKLYNKMYNCGFIDERFGFEYFLDHKLGFCVFSGSSDYCDRVKDMLLSEIESLKNFGIDENEVIRSRKKHIGEFIRNFNSISNIVNNQAELLIKGTGLDEMLAKIRQIDASKINKRLNSLFKNNLCALSLIEKS